MIIMTGLSVLTALCCLMTVLLYRMLHPSFGRPGPAVFLFATDGDEDMKIAGDTFSPAGSGEDSAEAAARQFLRQKDAGNIELARELGKDFADSIIALAGEFAKDARTQLQYHHRLLLCAYVINRVISEHSPDPMVAQTSLNVFYGEIEAASADLHQHVSDMAGFSLYILSERSKKHREDDIGRTYARLCGMDGEEPVGAEGNRMYHNFYKECLERIQNTPYSEVGGTGN